MNKRIIELAFEVAECTNWKPGLGNDNVQEYMEKFAELIVKECAKICNDVSVAVFSEPVQNNLGTAQTCKVAIEKHFGIEE